MAPPPTLEHLNILRDKYGEDKSPSRRQIADWLKYQEINQIYAPSKEKPKDIKSSMTTPIKILAMDLVDLQKFQVRGY